MVIRAHRLENQLLYSKSITHTLERARPVINLGWKIYIIFVCNASSPCNYTESRLDESLSACGKMKNY